jgi:hypothetical protein
VGFEYNSSPECGGTFPTGQCWPCQPTGQIIKSWLRFTPEFHAIVVLISAPITLTLAMWGMLSRKDRMILMDRSNAGNASGKKPGLNYDVSQVTTLFNQFNQQNTCATLGAKHLNHASPHEALEINVLSVPSSDLRVELPQIQRLSNKASNDKSGLHRAEGPVTSIANQNIKQYLSQPQNEDLRCPFQLQELNIVDSAVSAAPTRSSSVAVVAQAAKTIKSLAPERIRNTGTKSRWLAAIQSSIKAASHGVRTDQISRDPDSLKMPRLVSLDAHDASGQICLPQPPPRSRSGSRLSQTTACNEKPVAAQVSIREQLSLATSIDSIEGCRLNLQGIVPTAHPTGTLGDVPQAPPRSRSNSRFRIQAAGNHGSDAASISARSDSRALQESISSAGGISLSVEFEEC